MLVGTLPFPGRTAAQLAKQHTQSEPQLNSLPAEDRQAVARALAKKPTDRFPSCRAFVDTLLHRADLSPTAAPTELPRPIPVAPPPSAPDPDDTKPSSVCATLRRTPDTALHKSDATFTQPVKRDTPPPAPATKIEFQQSCRQHLSPRKRSTLRFQRLTNSCAANSRLYTWRRRRGDSITLPIARADGIAR